MIDRVVIRGYRCFAHLDFEPNKGMNILAGRNEAGKSTVLEALALALTGRINGRWAAEELNPYWFHRPHVLDFFARQRTEDVKPPEIHIEIFLTRSIDALHSLRGVHNSQKTDCPGVAVHITPSPEYSDEFRDYLESEPPSILPVEYYSLEWRHFGDYHLTRRPKELATSFIDSRTIRSTSGVDYHTREMLSGNLDGKERAMISLAHRKSRQEVTETTLAEINTRIAKDNAKLHHSPVGLQMDQSARASWEAGVVPQVDEIPFAMAGQGQQAAIKVSLAMSRTAHATFLLIEEPETHLSHTSLRRLIARIEDLAEEQQQLFVSTHSSFVLNRLGLDALILLSDGPAVKLRELKPDTVAFFRKLSGYDTLRLALADRAVLVEGPSDAMLFQRAFKDALGRDPADLGIDTITMGGLTARRSLELCAKLDRQVLVLQDNDGRGPEVIAEEVRDYLRDGKRTLLISDPRFGRTLEPQLVAANDPDVLRSVLGVTERADLETWMTNNKTEAALRVLDASTKINYPEYIRDAVKLLE
jgi:putative ATP-dependent endonuclease of the OLD family